MVDPLGRMQARQARAAARRASELEIIAISAHESDAVMWISGALSIGEINIVNVEDMVEQINRKCSGGKRIKSLEIVGHGNDTGQHVGADWLSATSLRTTHGKQLKKLEPHFMQSAVVTLEGCKVGQAEELLKRLSLMWPGVRVRAKTALQRPLIPGDEGGVRECVNGRCTYSGAGFWDWVDND